MLPGELIDDIGRPHRPPPGRGALGIGATMLMWPSGGPESWASGAYVDELSTGRLAQRQLPGIVPGDYSPYLITVGSRLVYVSRDGTTAIAANLTGKPRVLGTTQFFAPSAEPGHVWLSYDRQKASVVRSVPVTGGQPGPAITLPRKTFLAQGTDRGLLLGGPPNGTLLLWTPGRGCSIRARAVTFGPIRTPPGGPSRPPSRAASTPPWPLFLDPETLYCGVQYSVSGSWEDEPQGGVLRLVPSGGELPSGRAFAGVLLTVGDTPVAYPGKA